MDTKLLEYFIHVADCENISQAAIDLYISQPSLSAAIRRLEKELGKPLFDRVGKRLRLNEQGRRFLPTARQIVMMLTNAVNQDERYGAFSILFRYEDVHIMDLVERFHRESESITISVFTGYYGKIEYPVSSFDFIVDRNRIGFRGEIITTGLVEDKYFVVLPLNHRLAYRKVLTLRELKDETFIFLRGINLQYEWTYQVCVNEGMVPNCTLTANDNLCKLRLLANGCGVSIISEAHLDIYNGITSLKVLPLVGISGTHAINIWASENVDENLAAYSFLKFLKENIHK